jgi:hypothetical protein
VQLVVTNALGNTACVGNNSCVRVENGMLYVLANNAEEVGRIFPDAVNISLVGAGYIEETDDKTPS